MGSHGADPRVSEAGPAVAAQNQERSLGSAHVRINQWELGGGPESRQRPQHLYCFAELVVGAPGVTRRWVQAGWREVFKGVLGLHPGAWAHTGLREDTLESVKQAPAS